MLLVLVLLFLIFTNVFLRKKKKKTASFWGRKHLAFVIAPANKFSQRPATACSAQERPLASARNKLDWEEGPVRDGCSFNAG